jgi:hypothetical protein
MSLGDVDEATQKQLAKLRIRGVPAIKPGMPNFVGEYPCREVQMPAVRVLHLGWAEGVIPTGTLLRDAFKRLATIRAQQKLAAAGDPMWVCLADPYLVEPPKRAYAALLPFRGAAREDGEVKVSRLDGGFYITTTTFRGLPDLENVYTFLFGRFLPMKSHVLARPSVVHRIVGARDGLPIEDAMDRDLLVEVAVPAGFEMKKRDPRVTEGGGA